jgi:DNA-binding MarR family transcriptional regulator
MEDSVDRLVAAWMRELPAADAVREQVVSRIIRISRHLTDQGRVSAASDGLALWQFKTLVLLRGLGPPYETSPSSLAELLDLTRGAVTSRLTWLEDLGLVERKHDRVDRRRVTVRLTAAGHEALERVTGVMEAREGRALEALDPTERDQLANLLRKVLLALEDESSQTVVGEG